MRRFRAPKIPEANATDEVTPEGEGRAAPGAAGDPETHVTGERGISSIHRGRSLQSRITNLLSAGLMSVLGIGFLGWYYAHTFAAESAAHRSGQAALQRQASGTVPLPPLGPLHGPVAVPPGASLMASTLGPPPALSASATNGVPVMDAPGSDPGYAEPVMPAAETPSPRELALARALGPSLRYASHEYVIGIGEPQQPKDIE